MAGKRPDRVREQVVVYLDARDRQLLEEMAESSGLPRTELFRRGLRRLAAEILAAKQPGSSLAHLVDTAAEDDFPPDVSTEHDRYLYGGGYEASGAGLR
ncbi:MAG: hypothetical protein WEG36_03870 [Gemmatimonadota bacterium]